MSRQPKSFDLESLRNGYAASNFSPEDVVEEVLRRIEARGDDKVWIHLSDRNSALAMARDLASRDTALLPLYGLPFAIKDNIDWAGHPTTAGCPAYAYTPERSAFVVQRLIDAGAIPIGKTNLDQFATGLVGVRSPYGAPVNPFDPRMISGGSSSGSAVAVAAGQVAFALGTDTAGSGRVPAAFNNIVGLKPSRGMLSTTGVVPACRSLDCVSILALTATDALAVLKVASAYDPSDPFSRPEAQQFPLQPQPVRTGFRFGFPRPEQLEFFGNTHYPALYDRARVAITELGGEAVEIDFSPFADAARLLYEGPWVAERFVAIEAFLRDQPEALHPVTRAIIQQGATPSAADAFKALYRLEELRRASAGVWERIDVLLLPTAGSIYSIEQVEADPIQLNSNLGYYTNFVNLLDLCGIAVPAKFGSDNLPFGITLIAPAFQESMLAGLGDAFHRHMKLSLGATGHPHPEPAPATGDEAPPGWVRLCVIGAHMRGLALNRQLTERGGRFVREDVTAAEYRLYALKHLDPVRPGMLRVEAGGASLSLEIWELSEAAFGNFVAQICPPLGIGTVNLAGGEQVKGFLGEVNELVKGEEITELGGWRAFLKSGR